MKAVRRRSADDVHAPGAAFSGTARGGHWKEGDSRLAAKWRGAARSSTSGWALASAWRWRRGMASGSALTRRRNDLPGWGSCPTRRSPWRERREGCEHRCRSIGEVPAHGRGRRPDSPVVDEGGGPRGRRHRGDGVASAGAVAVGGGDDGGPRAGNAERARGGPRRLSEARAKKRAAKNTGGATKTNSGSRSAPPKKDGAK